MTQPGTGAGRRRPPSRKLPGPTTPVPKYGPTPVYDDCESSGCSGRARTACESCQGLFCRNHAEHPHRDPAPSS